MDLRRKACCELASEVIRASGEAQLKLHGTSMIPAVWPGDVVTVQRREFGDVRPGHIVICRGEGSLVAHRVKRLSHNHLFMRGDSLSRLDPPFADSDVVGQVVSIHRNGKPVSIKRSMRHRVVSCIIRRSDLLSRVTLRIGSRPWSAADPVPSSERPRPRRRRTPLRVLRRNFA